MPDLHLARKEGYPVTHFKDGLVFRKDIPCAKCGETPTFRVPTTNCCPNATCYEWLCQKHKER